ncbi:hypothetical protein BCON_0019g00150 [Botryotinia convoluta]|uniref:Uncharacterized protein n=1 Tax=Botryotinia convoluta TaxID=54673 RepID=A0A4Z1IT27_9HELO|nr:hypothetical protein BCON_0019g00150 [Botryotinia convoluta]
MNVVAMRENGEKGVSIQNVEWASDGYAGLDIGMVLMNNDEVIFAMIKKRPVGWSVLKVEVSLGIQWETQGNSTTLYMYPRGSAQHSSFAVEMALLSQNISIVGRWNDPYDCRTTRRTDGRPAFTYCGVEGQLSREARLHKLDQNCPVVDQAARNFFGLNQKES